MALTLIKEDGTGKVDANSYANVADGDAYFDGHVYATTWTAASNANKEKALVMATRLIDSQYQFNGWKAHDSQALQWPRERCHDPDKGPAVSFMLLANLGTYVEADEVPKAVIDATCEMAKELLLLDRTTAPPGEGISYTYAGTDGTGYSKRDVRPIISHVAQAMLSKFGTLISAGSGNVSLIRV